MLPTYQRIGGSQPSNPLLSVRRSFRSSEKCLILLVLLTFGFVCFGGFFFLPDNFGADRVLKVYKQFQRAGPEIFIPPPPPAHGLDGDEDFHKLSDREKLQEKIRKELPDDFLEKPDLDGGRGTDGTELDNALDGGAGAVGPMVVGGPPGVVAPPQMMEEPELKGGPSRGSTGSSGGGFHVFNSTIGEDPDAQVREKRNKVKEDANERLGKLLKICSSGLNVTEELANRYRQIDFPDDPTTKCVLRCIALNLGVYDDLNGIHMHDTWLMFRGGRKAAGEKAFADQHFGCIAKNLAQVPKDDYCGKVYGVYLCYREEYQALLKKRRVAGS